MKNLHGTLQEILKLREYLYETYSENNKITKKVLLVSLKLDQSINNYMKLCSNKK
ncbi:MAG: Spo0E family sporulation regulatory protein-aspartic acid phosphatase [Firmicutes bacterium]|nr:Spo0E family sporulation regulatory protein-aspartic acid phosphatase [Bacillota bacterium]